MNGLQTLAAMGVVIAITALILWSALRAASKAGAKEAEADAWSRRIDAIKADQERANAKEEAAQDARRVPVDSRSDAADVLRNSGRLRKTGN